MTFRNNPPVDFKAIQFLGSPFQRKKNLNNKQKPSQKISNSEEFYKAFDEAMKKAGLSDKLIKTPSQPTKEYTVVFRPFAHRRKEKKL